MLNSRQKQIKNLSQEYFNNSCLIDFSLHSDNTHKQDSLFHCASEVIIKGKKETTDILFLELLFEEGLSFLTPPSHFPLVYYSIFYRREHILGYLIDKKAPLFWEKEYSLPNNWISQILFTNKFNCALSLFICCYENLKDSNILNMILEQEDFLTFYPSYQEQIINYCVYKNLDYLLDLLHEKKLNISVNNADPLIHCCEHNLFSIFQAIIPDDLLEVEQDKLIHFLANNYYPNNHFGQFLSYVISIRFGQSWIKELLSHPNRPKFMTITDLTRLFITDAFARKNLQDILHHDLSIAPHDSKIKI